MKKKLYCVECGNEVRVGEQTDLGECIDYRDNRGGIVCERCDKKMVGFQNVMILPRTTRRSNPPDIGGIEQW